MLDYDLQDYVLNAFYLITYKLIEDEIGDSFEYYSQTIKEFTDYLLSNC